MIKHLIESTRGSQFEGYLDEESIKDIAQVVTVEKDLFDQNEMRSKSNAIVVQGSDDINVDDEDSVQYA